MNEQLDEHIDAYSKEFDYSLDNDVMLNWYPRRIIEKTDPENISLELGIGHGYTTNHFSNYYNEHFAIDGSGLIIDKFKEMYPDSKSHVIHSYFENFETDQTFDVIIMGFVLEHVDDPVQILNRFKNYLSPNGRCFVSVPNAESLHRRFGHAAGLLPDMLALGSADKALGHQRSYTVSSMANQLEYCGYKIINTEGIFLKPITTNQLKSLELTKDVLEGMCKVGIDYPELSLGLLFEVEPVK